MHVSSRSVVAGLILAMGLLAQTTSYAVSLTEPVATPFADTVLPGTTVAARPELAGTVLEDVLTPFSFNGVTGTVQNRVVRETSTGTLDFYWKVDVDANSTGEGVSAFRLIDFGDEHLTDADWRIDGLGSVAPTTGRLFNEASYPTGAINFLFDGVVTAGSASRFFFLHTDATSYALSAQYDLLTGGEQALSSAFSSFAPVPEPESYGMAAVGLVLTGVMMRRRRSH